MTKENVVFDTSASRYDLAIKEVEERVKLGWSVKASFMLGGGYLRVDYVRADPNRYKYVGKSSNTLDTNESVDTDIESSGYGGLGSVGCEEATQEVAKETVEAPVEAVEQKPKTTRKTTTTAKKG